MGTWRDDHRWALPKKTCKKWKRFYARKAVEIKWPMCGGEDFAVEALVRWLEMAYGLAEPEAAGGKLPIVLITCKNCSYISTFNAYRMEILN